MQMTSTLWGMEQYYKYKGKSLFDDIRLPNGVDKQTLVNTILIESGEFEVMYTDGDFLKVAINTWFERKYNMIDRWIKAINIDYKPLENYNRTEKWTDKANGTTSNNGTKNSKTSNSGTDTLEGITSNNGTKNFKTKNSGTDKLEGKTSNNGSKNSKTNNSGSDNGTDTNNETIDNTSSGSTAIGAQTSSDETKVSAFNTDTYSPSQKDESTIGTRTDTTSGTGKTTTAGTLTKNNSYENESTVVDTTSDSSTVNNTNTHASESTVEDTTTDKGTSSNTSEHSGVINGNIGVTTSQQMLESEMTLWGKIDIYRDTAEMFIQDFCIMVY